MTRYGRGWLCSALGLLLVACTPVTSGVGPSSSPRANAGLAGAGSAIPAGTTSGLEHPFGVAVGGDSIWATEYERGNLVRIDPKTSRVISRRHVSAHASRVVAQGRFIWVTDDLAGVVICVDGTTGQTVREISLRSNFDLRPSAIAAADESVWVTLTSGFEHSANAPIAPGQLVRLTSTSNDVLTTIPIRGVAAGVAVGGGAVWVASLLEPTSVYRIDPATHEVAATIATGHPISSALAYLAPDLWVANQDGYLTQIDARTNRVVGNFEVGSPEWPALVAQGNAVWLSAPLDNLVARFDPQAGAISTALHTGARPQLFAVSANALWVANYVDGTVAKLALP
jgi:streptogramin lyase